MKRRRDGKFVYRRYAGRKSDFMLRDSLFVLLCVLLPACNAGLVSDAGHGLLQNENVEREGEQKEISITRIAPAFEAGKFSFDGTAIFEDGKILSIGYDGETFCNMRISTDRGKTWTTRPFTEDRTVLPDSIYFADSQHGWIGGAMGVFRTIDGGDTWRKTKIDRYLRWTELSFYGVQKGYLAGKNNLEGDVAGEIWVTSDGGKTWKRSYMSQRWDSPFSVVALSENVAVAIFNEKHLIRTVDGGKSWREIKSYDYRTYNLSVDKKGRLWSAGHDGVFYVSSDQGLTWQRPEVLPAGFESIDWYDIQFVDDRFGFACGNKGAFAVTRDGGKTWERIELNLKDDLYKLYTNQAFGIISGFDYVYRIDF